MMSPEKVVQEIQLRIARRWALRGALLATWGVLSFPAVVEPVVPQLFAQATFVGSCDLMLSAVFFGIASRHFREAMIVRHWALVILGAAEQ